MFKAIYQSVVTTKTKSPYNQIMASLLLLVIVHAIAGMNAKLVSIKLKKEKRLAS